LLDGILTGKLQSIYTSVGTNISPNPRKRHNRQRLLPNQ
jgi:hypothetical protein